MTEIVRRHAENHDQRLLDSRGPADWVHTDPWRVLRIQAEFIDGFDALADLGPAVAIFGSSRPRRTTRWRSRRNGSAATWPGPG